MECTHNLYALGKQKIGVTHFILILAFLGWSGAEPTVSPRPACARVSPVIFSVFLPVCNFSLRWVFSAAHGRSLVAVRGRRVRWLLSLQSAGSGARRLHCLWATGSGALWHVESSWTLGHQGSPSVSEGS